MLPLSAIVMMAGVAASSGAATATAGGIVAPEMHI